MPLPFGDSLTGYRMCVHWYDMAEGTRSAMELASLGPATVLCESLIYCSTFLAIATTNLQATALADGKRAEAQKVSSCLLSADLLYGTAVGRCRRESQKHRWNSTGMLA